MAGCEQQGRQVIATSGAPAAIGPYSQAIKVGKMLFTAGQIPIDPATGELVAGTIEEQTRRVLDNLGAVLKAAGMDFGDVVSATVYMDDIANYPRINQVYAEYFPHDPPARCAMQVARLPKGAALEIALVAVKD
ncbi:MAG: RidA family protein [candidate division KSB1 bacterium]|nr:RidA family protein [candidate division KSB1 bacterium]MDZ7294909.1 RidA family protein [candidate division KSB1 bacterium]MDZ7337483.1 RidA family protein [candidate division KSB1 bacterium]MDZ7386213.1 RidA family protein [candidate division KSB1 bacterium]MDZ7391738.1 RidA family protein [candidate division KSB1 bacterium]